MILTVAYLTERKGLEFLIKACAKLKKENDDFVLVIVGEGSCKEDLKRLSAQNNIETIFVGYVLNLVDYYLAADVFVLPTLEDVWGFVINEAMVCGCPIVTTYGCGASRDLVKNRVNGYLVEARNIEQLSQAVRIILHDDKLRQDMKSASRNIIRNFSYKTSLNGYSSVINNLMNKKSIGKRTKH